MTVQMESINNASAKQFQLLVDGVPYTVKASPFPFNEQTLFYINVNGGIDHMFAWDTDIKRLRALDDSSSILPDALEQAISRKLQSR